MKKIILILIILIVSPLTGYARDYVIDIVSENYQEETDDFKHHLQIYHSIQITSIAGQKVLIITGNNYQYRTWLREYIANSKKMIIKIPDKDNNEFISSQAYIIDVTSIYPVNENKWDGQDSSARLKIISGEKHILIVDSNVKRRKLLNQIIRNLGYPVTFLSDSKEALQIFKIQPDNFHMVIANYDMKNFDKINFVEKLSNISPQTPIIVGGAYNNNKINEKLFNDFSMLDNVTIRPIILQDLSKLIVNLLKNKA
ncbi:MAG: response regulator [Desulfobacteraceae bacterium]|nr:response regulator [Desulfobacteraceae bacterium]